MAVVLGARVEPDGSPSAFLTARLDLARRLYETGKVRLILVSGDGRYAEPEAMRRYLIGTGLPPADVWADDGAIDTYRSCERARRDFGVDRAIVVTQTFHLPRAVALCRRLGMDADGVGDDSVRRHARAWRWAVIRERGAALKAAWDLTTR